jgi:hypothetical protein
LNKLDLFSSQSNIHGKAPAKQIRIYNWTEALTLQFHSVAIL